MYLIVWALLTIEGCYYGVANSKQNFPDSPGEKFGPSKKFRPQVILTFFKGTVAPD
jgi:hypothetical protein